VIGIDVSVLIATWRRPRLLAETLRSLAAMTVSSLRWEVLVVDNAADSGTAAAVRDLASRLPVRLLAEPVPGKNRALNRALADCTGGLVAFTDDDVLVEPDWLRELWEGAERWPNATVFGGRVLPRWPEDCEIPPTHSLFDHAYAVADFSRPEGPYSSGYVYGPNMAIRAAVFKAGWRFDTTIGPDGTDRYVTGSETSLTVALEKAGHEAIYLPRALVHHQIRPEQLTPGWLYGRAFRKGRAEALKRGVSGGLRFIPRELLITLAKEYASWWQCRVQRDREGTLHHGLAYWTARGMIFQCRTTPRTIPDRR
jgi:hypothetical protein